MIISILIFFLVLSVLVLVHEFGHYWVAKKSGVWVEEFGLGIPPRAWGKVIGKTLYSINWLPFGGFVRLHGEDSTSDHIHPEISFMHKSKKARAAIVVAGVVMNFLLAIVAFSIGYTFSGFPRETENVKIVGIAENSPAKEIGLTEGDVVREVNGERAASNEGFVSLVEKYKGQDVDLKVERNSEMLNFHVTPRVDHPSNQGALGVVISSTEMYWPPVWQRPFLGVYYGFKDAFFWGKVVVMGFGKIFTDLAGGTVPKDIAGPVGIFALTSQAASFGILPLINFMGILSVNLAVLNIFPFPALDGGRLFFILVEGLFGKKVLPKFEVVVHTVGMALLLLLLFAITAYDIKRLIAAGGIGQFLEYVAR